MSLLVDNEAAVVRRTHILLILNTFFVDSLYRCKIGNSECPPIGHHLGSIWFSRNS